MPLSEHLRAFRKLFMHSRDEKLLLFFDEVQESPNWEMELKALYDLEENTKMVCTGSTSSLIKRQGGKLTGRQIINHLYPLTFKEYLTFKGTTPSKSEDYQYEKLFENYLIEGGYPEHVLNPSLEYMNNLIDDIIARDIVRLHRINRADILKGLLTIVAQSVGSRSSYNKIAKIIGVTVDTIKEYMSFFEEAFLIKSLTKWSPSVSDKVYSQKKIYFFDTGIKTVLTGPGDRGVRVENLIFLHLIKSNSDVGYYAESERELDFVYGTFKDPKAIEVKYDNKFEWQDKRYRGVMLFLRRYPQTREVTIITQNIDQTIRESDVTISAIPAWKFLLS
jgi:predicted AAA+ superfamily ATPase